MAGITDTVFRLLMRKMGSQVVISELLSAEGLVRGGPRTRSMMQFDERERPVGIQIFGSNIDTMAEAAKIIQEEGADFVDINFGCPVKKVVCDGSGSAWLKTPDKMGELLSALKASLRIPLTIKVRTGWDEQNRNVKEVVKVAAQCGVSWVAIHGRTRAQGYSGLADWELIREVAISSSIPIIGNGDILTSAQAKKRIEDGYSHAVMIGRGALKNPWVFQDILETEGTSNYDLVQLIHEHFQLAIEKKDRDRAFLSLKKFMGWYAAGYPYSSAFRGSIFQTNDVDELRDLALEFFGRQGFQKPVDDGQPFLMGGHG
ncbi:MAG: tRNA dihydrouridine synthase DusB [Proteobacteria bacterium]|nr:tRNA dihydrouridine synthase DusB [Pseudomonadota bacterium]